MKKILFILSIAVLTFFSCTDEDLIPLKNLDKAAFVHFETAPDATIGTNTIAELVYAGELVAKGPVASYTLEVYGTLSGTNTDTAVVETYTSFPVNFSFTAQDLATLVGVEVTDINFGDGFTFLGTITAEDGSVYYGEAPEVEDVDDGPDIYTPNGSTNEEVYDLTNGYKQGMFFSFLIGCPVESYDPANIVGDYVYTDHYNTPSNVTITADATIADRYWVEGMYSGWGYPIPNLVYFDVDPETLIMTAPAQSVGVPNFFGFPDLQWQYEAQLFPCATRQIDGIEDMLFSDSRFLIY